MDFDHNFSRRSIGWISTTRIRTEALYDLDHNFSHRSIGWIWTTTFHPKHWMDLDHAFSHRSIGWIWTTTLHTEALNGFVPQLFTQKHWILTLFMLIGALILHSESFVMLEPYTSYLKHLGFLIRQLNSLISYWLLSTWIHINCTEALDHAEALNPRISCWGNGSNWYFTTCYERPPVLRDRFCCRPGKGGLSKQVLLCLVLHTDAARFRTRGQRTGSCGCASAHYRTQAALFLQSIMVQLCTYDSIMSVLLDGWTPFECFKCSSWSGHVLTVNVSSCCAGTSDVVACFVPWWCHSQIAFREMTKYQIRGYDYPKKDVPLVG